MIRHLLLALLIIAGGCGTGMIAAEALPPAPSQYVTDEAGVIAPAVLAGLNRKLDSFEKSTSSQIVAMVYPKLPEGVVLDDYAQILYQAWKIGTKKNSNGALILVFVKDRKVRIQTGYGLEGALPDALCARIVRQTMAPAFRMGKYSEGLSAGVMAVMQATKGEYKGSVQEDAGKTPLKDFLFSPLGLFLLVLIVLILMNRNRRDLGSTNGGISPSTAAATGFFLGSGGWGGGSGGRGDSGGFSGGGGESGGGGGGGDW